MTGADCILDAIISIGIHRLSSAFDIVAFHFEESVEGEDSRPPSMYQSKN